MRAFRRKKEAEHESVVSNKSDLGMRGKRVSDLQLPGHQPGGYYRHSCFPLVLLRSQDDSKSSSATGGQQVG
jgi:hypothetical protein